jgi:membrane protein
VKFRGVRALFGEAFTGWREHKASNMAAALAYYTVFSLAPILVISIAVAGLVFGQEAAEGRIVGQISGLVGRESALALEAMIAAARAPSSSIAATVLGLATLLFGATGVFGELQDSLNTIWGVKPKPGRGLIRLLKTRFVSFTMVLGIGFLLLVSLVVSAAISAIGAWLSGLLPLPEVVLQGINLVVSIAVVALLFAMIFRFLPDVEIGWRDVWAGAVFTAVLFGLGKLAIGLYLGKSSVASSYGAAGALVLILVWVYYSAQILFFGAELTRAWAYQQGSRIAPDEDAVPASQPVGRPAKQPVEEAVAAGDERHPPAPLH